MQHLDEGTIHAWLDGALPPEQAADVERHARTCSECATLVADARGVIAGAARIVSALDDVPGGVIPARQPHTSTRSLWRTLRLTPFRAALAASLMVAVASLLVVRNAPEAKPDTATASAAPAVASPAPTRPAEPAVNVAKETGRAEAASKVVDVPRAAPKPPARASAFAEAAAVDSAKAVAKPTSVLAESKDQKPTVGESANSRPAEAKARAADLAPVVATSAPRAAAGGAPAPMAPPAANVERDALRREVMKLQQASFVALSADDRPIQPPGCFQLLRDSVSRLPQIPERFSLELVDESGEHRNIVRAVNTAGRPDSIIAGMTWRLMPGSTQLELLSNAPSAPTMSFRSPATAQSNLGARKAVVGSTLQSVNLPRISRVECR